MTYAAPLADMRFVLEEVAGIAELAALPGYQAADNDLVEAVLEEAGKFAAGELAPLNQPADRIGSILENGVVRTPPGFREAYGQYVEAGWGGLIADPEYGGQGLPLALAAPVTEMWNSACMAFALCPLLTLASVELLQAYGSDEQKQRYLGRLVSGEWAGTMNLTEPQAGSDLGTLRTRAVPAHDPQWGDHYRVTGQKIFITYGDHDLAPNIIHAVLARTPDAPPGSRGLSLFLVPKFLLDDEGQPGQRNAVRPLSLEHKLGIHASPTCVLAYEDAIGWRIGEENRGLEYMFTMMNNARLNIGVQGLAIAERAYQQARDFARTRVQGRPLGAPAQDRRAADHSSSRCQADAAVDARRDRGDAGARLLRRGNDRSRPARPRPGRARRSPAPRRPADPGGQGVVQRYGCDGRLDRHPGAWRDGLHRRDRGGATSARRPHRPDLRRHQRHSGKRPRRPQTRSRPWARRWVRCAPTSRQPRPRWTRRATSDLAAIGSALRAGLGALETATAYLVDTDPASAAAGSTPYLQLSGAVYGGWLMARQALAASRRLAGGEEDVAFLAAKIATARFFAEHFLAMAPGYLAGIRGGATVLDFDPEQL